MISFMRVWFGTDKFQVSNFKYSGCGIWKAKFEFFLKSLQSPRLSPLLRVGKFLSCFEI